MKIKVCANEKCGKRFKPRNEKVSKRQIYCCHRCAGATSARKRWLENKLQAEEDLREIRSSMTVDRATVQRDMSNRLLVEACNGTRPYITMEGVML